MDPANVLWLALDEVRRATGDVTGVNHIFCLLTLQRHILPPCQPRIRSRIPNGEWNQVGALRGRMLATTMQREALRTRTHSLKECSQALTLAALDSARGGNVAHFWHS